MAALDLRLSPFFPSSEELEPEIEFALSVLEEVLAQFVRTPAACLGRASGVLAHISAQLPARYPAAIVPVQLVLSAGAHAHLAPCGTRSWG